jgi:gliding motility-associated-like protein
MKYLSFILLFLLHNNISYSQVNQSKSICSGASINLTSADFGLPDTTNFTWNYSIGAGNVSGYNSTSTSTKIFNQTLYVSGNVVGVVIYYITPSYGNPFTVTANVNPTNMVIDASTIAPIICSGSNFYASVSGVPTNTQYTWTTPIMSTGVINGTGQNTPQSYIVQPLVYTGAANTSGTATYTVTPSVGGCTNPSFSFNVTVNLTGGTAPIISNKGTIAPKCSGTSTTFTATASPSAGVTFQGWVRTNQYGIKENSSTGNSSAINETLNDTLNTPISVSYFYNLTYGTGGKCMTTEVVNITINPVAIITAKQINVCSGSSMSVNINDIIPGNTRYTWTLPSISTGTGTVSGASAQTTQVSLITQTLTNNPVSRAVPVTLNYTVTPFAITGAYSCQSPTFPITVILNPVSTTTQLTATTCSNQPFNISLTSFPVGTNFTWNLAPTVAPTTSAISGGTNQTSPISVISQTLTNNTTSAATATYVVTPVTDKCTGSVFNAIVTVNPLPNIVNVNQVATVCSGSALTITQSGVPTNTTYTWSTPTISPANTTTGESAKNAQASFSQTITNNTVSPITANYTITPNAGSCSGAPFNILVTVKPLAIYTTQSYSSCSGINFTFNPYNPPEGTTYTWNLPSYPQNSKLNGGSSQSLPANNINQTLINSADTSSTAIYTIKPNTNGCVGPDFTLLITVNPLPTVPDIVQSNCSGSPFTVIPNSSIPGTLYTWNAPEIPLNNISGGLSKLTPASNITGTLINVTLANAIAKYIITPIANGCTGNTFNLIQTINPIPSVGLLTSKICSNTAFDASPTGLPINAITTYTWNNPVISPANALAGGSKQDSAVTNISQILINNTNAVATASYNVTPSTGGCVGNPFKVVITVTPRAALPDINTTICSGGTFIVVPNNAPIGTKFSWLTPTITTGILGGQANALYVDTITQTLINSNSNVSIGLAKYEVTPITDGCTGSPFYVNANVNSSNAILSSTLNPASVCSKASFIYSPTSSITGTSFLWTRDTVSGIDNLPKYGYGDINETLINNTNNPITVKYSFTLSSNGCTNLNKQTIFIVVNPIPKLNSSINPASICSGATFNYSATSSTINVLFDWERSYVAGINEAIANGSGNISEILTNKTSNVLLVPYIYTLSANGCSNVETIFATVNPVLVSPDISSTICSGTEANVTSITLPQNTLYTWSSVSNTGGVFGSSSQTYSSQKNIIQKLFNNTNQVGYATYSVTPSLPSQISNGCLGKAFTLTIIVNPLPVLTSSYVAPAICSNTEFNYTPISNILGTVFNWYRDASSGLQNTKSAGVGFIKETLIDSTINPINIVYKFVLTANGCSDTSYIVKVLVNPAPLLSDKTITVCSGSSFNLPNNLMPFNTTYKWGNPVILPSNSLTGYKAATTPQTIVIDSLYNNTLNNATAIYTIQPINSSCSIAPFNLIVNTTPTPTVADQEISICSGTDFVFVPNKIPDNSVFEWANPVSQPYGVVNGYISDSLLHKNIKQRLFNPSINTAKAIYKIRPSNNGCNGNDFKLTVNVNPIPTYLVTSVNEVCPNVADTLYLTLLGNGPWNISYIDPISGIANTLKNLTAPSQKVVVNKLPEVGPYKFKLVNIQDAYCYNDTSTIINTQQILPLPKDSIYAPSGNQICINQTLPLNINNATASLYKWYFNDTLFIQSSNNNIQVGKPGIYYAETKNTFGCINKTINTVTMRQVFVNPAINFTNDISCSLLPINFANLTDTLKTGQLNWTWYFTKSDSSNGYNSKYTFKNGGSYTIRLVAKSLICNYTTTKDSTILIRLAEPGMKLPPITTYINTNTRIKGRDLIGESYQYKWEPFWGLDSTKIASPLFNFNINQVYKINYITKYGCVTTDTLPVYVFANDIVDIFVPKSFSPNGDGVNDQLYPYLAGIKNFHFIKIYNKFGQLMFESKSNNIPWDGIANGHLQPIDAYVWFAEGEDINGKIFSKTGSVMLLR